MTTDAHGVIDYLNQSAEALTGMRREEAVGRGFGAMIGFVDENDRRAIADPVQQCLATGNRVNLGRRSILISRATGNELGVEATASPIREAGGRRRRRRGDAARRQRAARPHAADVLPGEPRRAHRSRQPPRVRAPPRRGARDRARRPPGPRDVLPGPRPVQGRQRHQRPPGGRQHAARGGRADPRGGARFRHGRAPRRRRVRRPAGRLPARQGAPDRGRRPARDRRVPVRVEGPHFQRRRQHRHRRDHGREQFARGDHERRGFRLLCRQEAGRRPHPRLFLARRGRGAQPRRDPLAAAPAGGAARRLLRAVRAADRADAARRRRDRARDGGVRAPARRGPGDRAGRVLPGRGALPADVHDRPLGARLGARRARRGRDPPAAGTEPRAQHLRRRRSPTRPSSSSSWTSSTAPASRLRRCASRSPSPR